MRSRHMVSTVGSVSLYFGACIRSPTIINLFNLLAFGRECRVAFLICIWLICRWRAQHYHRQHRMPYVTFHITTYMALWLPMCPLNKSVLISDSLVLGWEKFRCIFSFFFSSFFLGGGGTWQIVFIRKVRWLRWVGALHAIWTFHCQFGAYVACVFT